MAIFILPARLLSRWRGHPLSLWLCGTFRSSVGIPGAAGWFFDPDRRQSRAKLCDADARWNASWSRGRKPKAAWE
ncbi:uncharacterized protein BDV14DRAFT_171816 [Aspergillus stella-maris]|uniref:uncharacterized protein n=1 Tax=Aspergillus stella-maris TaxID=1810926 RepID=UPI003CCE0C64